MLLNSSEIDLNLLTDGQTPLHKAHEGGHKEIMIELLNDKRTKTNIPDKTFPIRELFTNVVRFVTFLALRASYQ